MSGPPSKKGVKQGKAKRKELTKFGNELRSVYKTERQRIEAVMPRLDPKQAKFVRRWLCDLDNHRRGLRKVLQFGTALKRARVRYRIAAELSSDLRKAAARLAATAPGKGKSDKSSQKARKLQQALDIATRKTYLRHAKLQDVEARYNVSVRRFTAERLRLNESWLAEARELLAGADVKCELDEKLESLFDVDAAGLRYQQPVADEAATSSTAPPNKLASAESKAFVHSAWGHAWPKRANGVSRSGTFCSASVRLDSFSRGEMSVCFIGAEMSEPGSRVAVQNGVQNGTVSAKFTASVQESDDDQGSDDGEVLTDDDDDDEDDDEEWDSEYEGQDFDEDLDESDASLDEDTDESAYDETSASYVRVTWHVEPDDASSAGASTAPRRGDVYLRRSTRSVWGRLSCPSRPAAIYRSNSSSSGTVGNGARVQGLDDKGRHARLREAVRRRVTYVSDSSGSEDEGLSSTDQAPSFLVLDNSTSLSQRRTFASATDARSNAVVFSWSYLLRTDAHVGSEADGVSGSVHSSSAPPYSALLGADGDGGASGDAEHVAVNFTVVGVKLGMVGSQHCDYVRVSLHVINDAALPLNGASSAEQGSSDGDADVQQDASQGPRAHEKVFNDADHTQMSGAAGIDGVLDGASVATQAPSTSWLPAGGDVEELSASDTAQAPAPVDDGADAEALQPGTNGAHSPATDAPASVDTAPRAEAAPAPQTGRWAALLDPPMRPIQNRPPGRPKHKDIDSDGASSSSGSEESPGADSSANNMSEEDDGTAYGVRDDSPAFASDDFRAVSLTRLSTSKLLWLWRRLPFGTRKTVTAVANQRYQLPLLHADPRVAEAINPRAPRLSDSSLRARGYDYVGKSSDPLKHLEPWHLEHALQLPVRNWDLYKQALTTTQSLPKGLRQQCSLERLEYLGDAVAGLAVRDMLHRRLPNANEGDMTLMSQRLVSGLYMYRLALLLGYDKFVAADVVSMRASNHLSVDMLSDVFEAVLGAIYLDHGFDTAQRWYLERLTSAFNLADWRQYPNWRNALSTLAARVKAGKPRFENVSSHTYRDKDSGLRTTTDVIRVVIGGRDYGMAESVDSKAAQNEACRIALSNLGCITDPFSCYDLDGAWERAHTRAIFPTSHRTVPLVRELASLNKRPLYWEPESTSLLTN